MSRYAGLPGSDRGFPPLTGRSGTQRARRWEAHGDREHGWCFVLIALVLVVFRYSRERALLPWGFILSPSATLRVAGLAPQVKVEHTTV